MRPDYLGDSYDLVKRALLEQLRPLGEWSAHPLFTTRVTTEVVRAYERLLNVRVLIAEPLSGALSLPEALACCDAAKNVFLDPDTGISLSHRGTRAHLSVELVTRVARARPEHVTMLFDQSYAHCKREARRSKVLTRLRLRPTRHEKRGPVRAVTS